MNAGLVPLYEVPESPPKLHSSPSAEEPLDDQGDFEPCTFFVYGSLMDPHVLTKVLTLEEAPQLRDAWIEGFEMKMWNSIYPTLLPTDTDSAQSRIKGKAWRATTMDQCLCLQMYETWAYEATDCRIYLVDGEPVKGLVFTWARDPKSSELVGGLFDLEHWQKTHKATFF